MSDSENQRLLFEVILAELNRTTAIVNDLSKQIADLRVDVVTCQLKMEALENEQEEDDQVDTKPQGPSLDPIVEAVKGKWALWSSVVTGGLALLGYVIKELLTK